MQNEQDRTKDRRTQSRWSARHGRTVRDRAFLGQLLLFLMFVLVAPPGFALSVGLAPSGLGLSLGTGVTSMDNLPAKTQAVWDMHVALRPAIGTAILGPSVFASFGVVGASSADGGFIYNGFTHGGATAGVWVNLGEAGIARAPLIEVRGGGAIGQYRNTNSIFFTPQLTAAGLYPLGRSSTIWRWWLAPAVTWSRRDPEVTTVTVTLSIAGGVAVPLVQPGDGKRQR